MSKYVEHGCPSQDKIPATAGLANACAMPRLYLHLLWMMWGLTRTGP